MAVGLTGAREEAACRTAAVRPYGGGAIVQDPATAELPVMPPAVMAAGAADHVAPLEELPATLGDAPRRRRAMAGEA